MASCKTFFIWQVPVKTNHFFLSLTRAPPHVAPWACFPEMSAHGYILFGILLTTNFFFCWKITVLVRWKHFMKTHQFQCGFWQEAFLTKVFFYQRERDTWTEKLMALYDNRLLNFSASQKQPIILVPHRIILVKISEWVHVWMDVFHLQSQAKQSRNGECIWLIVCQHKPPITDSRTVESKTLT